MKLLILAFIGAAFAADKNCIEELEKANSGGMLGSFRPKCNSDGTYQDIQCHENYCYCVLPNNGKQIEETVSRFGTLETCECPRKRYFAIQRLKLGIMGGQVMRCDARGHYEDVQCWKGMCWCVDVLTGKPFANSQPTMGTPNCGKVIVP